MHANHVCVGVGKRGKEICTVTDRIVFYIYIVAQSIWINSIQFSINMFIIVTHCYAHQYI